MRNKDSNMPKALIQYVQETGLEIKADGEIVLPEWVKRLKVDVGLSYSAPNAIQWIREDPSLIVFGFEPLAESCERLRNLISGEADREQLAKQLIILPVALGQQSGEAQLHVTADDTASSSLLAPKDMRQRESVTVPVFPLADLMQALPWGKIQRVDYLKLDCQGLDLEILKSAGGGWLEKIAVITAESEDEQYLGSSNGLQDLIGYMKSNGFIHMNARSNLRVYIGQVLSKLSIVRALKIRLPVRKAKEVASPQLSVVVEDPTFVNRAFLREVMQGEITAFQRG